MTEQEWLGCRDPRKMLDSLGQKASVRKLRLLADACCRRIWALLPEPVSRNTVDVVARLADNRATPAEQRRASRAALQAVREAEARANHPPGGVARFADYAAEAICHAAYAAYYASRIDDAPPPLVGDDKVRVAAAAATAAANAVMYAAGAASLTPGVNPPDPNRGIMKDAKDQEAVAQAALCREIIGNPFRVASVEPIWLLREGNTGVSIAQAIYEGQDFSSLPILADALEDAGCSDEAILSHLRGPGPHVRGCWVIDLLLGRQ